MRTKPGTLLEAQFPAAVCNANIITTQRIVDAMLRALIEAAPERAIAACSGTMNLLNVGGYVPETGRYFNYIETYGGGQGAMHDRDGMNGVHSHMTNTRNAPVEAIEAAYPLRVRSYGLVPDSEGAGRWRGGVGMHREFEILGLVHAADGQQRPPAASIRGASFGGQRGDRLGRHGLGAPTARGATCRARSRRSSQQGDHLRTVTPGGGGWGDPLERPAGPRRGRRSRGARLGRRAPRPSTVWSSGPTGRWMDAHRRLQPPNRGETSYRRARWRQRGSLASTLELRRACARDRSAPCRLTAYRGRAAATRLPAGRRQ